MYRDCHVFANICWEMLVKTVANSRWALLKGYRKAARKCPKTIGWPLDNSYRVVEIP
jgi:hypothetical protein